MLDQPALCLGNLNVRGITTEDYRTVDQDCLADVTHA